MPKKKPDPRRARFVQELLMRKLWALGQIGRHLGMFGPIRAFNTSVESDPRAVMSLMVAYLDDSRSSTSRLAIAMMLDYYVPAWRSIINPILLGPIVSRDSAEVSAWRAEVLGRDKSCRRCDCQAQLEVHHIVPWAKAPELRTDPANGEVLCKSCHLQVTVANGR